MCQSPRFLVSSLAIVLLFSLAPAHAATIEKLEASVNSSIILLSDIVKFRETMKLRAQLDPLFTGTKVAADGPKADSKDIVDFLVDEKLISQLYPATDSEVEQEINSIQSNNHIDRASLKRALVDQGFTFEQYFELIRISLSKRNLIDRDIRTKVSISDDDVKNYYFNHYARNTAIPMDYKIGIITVSLKNYKSAGAAKEIAEATLKSIKNGESFEDAAKRVSDDGSASNGGDLGTMASDQMSPIIRDHATKLQIGQISDVFGGEDTGSYMILKLSDLKSSDNDRLDKMKDEIRNQLFSAETQHQIQLWLERQRLDAFIHHAGDPSIALTAASAAPAPGLPATVPGSQAGAPPSPSHSAGPLPGAPLPVPTSPAPAPSTPAIPPPAPSAQATPKDRPAPPAPVAPTPTESGFPNDTYK